MQLIWAVQNTSPGRTLGEQLAWSSWSPRCEDPSPQATRNTTKHICSCSALNSCRNANGRSSLQRQRFQKSGGGSRWHHWSPCCSCVNCSKGSNGVIDKVIHLLRKPFTANARDRTPPSCHEVHRPWLSCIAWIMHLLGEVKGVVHPKVLWIGWCWLQRHQSITTHTLLALVNLPLVEMSPSINLAQVNCMFLKQFTLFPQGQICAPVNVGIVLLTAPAKIRHRSGNNNKEAQLHPQLLSVTLMQLRRGVLQRWNLLHKDVTLDSLDTDVIAFEAREAHCILFDEVNNAFSVP